MSSDVIERAGYPVLAPSGPIYRVTRDGKIIGWFLLLEFPDGYFLPYGQVCPESGLFLNPSDGSDPGQ